MGERYKLEHHLGSGSFSSVCRCLDTVTGERVRSLFSLSVAQQAFVHPPDSQDSLFVASKQPGRDVWPSSTNQPYRSGRSSFKSYAPCG